MSRSRLRALEAELLTAQELASALKRRCDALQEVARSYIWVLSRIYGDGDEAMKGKVKQLLSMAGEVEREAEAPRILQ